MAGRLEDSDSQAEALTVLSELWTLLERLPDDDPAYKDLLDRRLVAAAESLNLGLAQHVVKTVGRFSEFEMYGVLAAAAEFRSDDAEQDFEARNNPRA